MNVSHRQLKAFILIARLRNFSRASEQLHIAQSGLSLMIRELETQLGFRLFNRTTRQVSLTPFGSEFLRVAEQNVENLEQAVDRVGKLAKQANTSLSIGAPPLTSSYVLPEAIAAFQEKHPDIRVTVVDTDIVTVSNMVREGQLDLGMGMFLKATPSTVREPLFRFSLVMASAAPSFQLSRAPRSWASVAGSDFICLPYDNPLQQLIDGYLLRAGHNRAPRFVVNFIETQLGLAAAGCGVAILPSTAIAACRGHTVRIQPLSEPLLDLDFYSLRDRSRESQPYASEFCETVRRCLPHFVAPSLAAASGKKRKRQAPTAA
ncbi:MAG TPA: LysR family transcriptional regulator [Bordetella sp.]